MKHILAFSGSNSSRSINQKLIKAVAKLGDGIEVIDLRDYSVPIYSYDIEQESGLPANTRRLLEKLQTADAFIISTPEHNSLPPAFFKNIYDWLSRARVKYMENKPVLLMATSTGKKGGQGALAVVEKMLARPGAEIVGRFSLPSFEDTFNEERLEISDESHLRELRSQLELFLNAVGKS